ncbi:hypothetical protein AB0D49_05610 [Streptomyces sp. NPDC048290]|uniref:hypothetical protein n=1 Tax=Streptomyces sp. NPDC048290 TaxID=3155811 RepID=UPI00344ADC19
MPRFAAAALGAFALIGVLAAPAAAIPDPLTTVDCAVQEVTGLVSLTGLGVPAEVPAMACLAP